MRTRAISNLGGPMCRPSTECMDVPDDTYGDGANASAAVSLLGRLAEAESPFFLSVGFSKPHLPFIAPKKYWDLYDRSNIPIASDPFIPHNVHPKSVGKMGEFYNYKLSDEKPNT